MSIETFGSYQLIKRLATGGMAQIYLARQLGLEGFEKLLVVKRILPHLAENEEFVRMFLDEARIAARLNHPNIVQIFNLGQQDDSFFIAMEYIHGEDARRVWKRADKCGTPLPIPLVCRVVMDACAGLDYAHKKLDPSGKPLGIVHRDISPQNILVTFEGGVKVVDFGIAKAADQATVTRSGVLKGKYSYMSPEQASGKKLDARSDIFALGVVLHELLTGARLFKRKSDMQTLQAVMACSVPPASEVNPRVPKDLDAVVAKALTLSPEDRYQEAVELQMALEDWLIRHQLPSSSAHLAAFMREIYAERLELEAKEGRPFLAEAASIPPAREGSPRSRAPGRSASPTPISASSKSGSDPDSTTAERPGGVRASRSQPVSSRPTVSAMPSAFSATSFSAPARPPPPVDLAELSLTETAAPIARRRRMPWGFWLLAVAVGCAAVGWFAYPELLASLPVTPVPASTPSVPPSPVPKPVTTGKTASAPEPVLVPQVPKKPQEPAPKPASPPSKPARVRLWVRSAPSGAALWIDGRRVGRTPEQVALVPGRSVRVRLEKAGHRMVERRIRVGTAERQVQHFTLDPLPPPEPRSGTVRFAVTPWAEVRCGTHDFGSTPFPDKKLPVGRYRCVFTNGGKSQTKRIQVLPNRRIVVQVKFD